MAKTNGRESGACAPRTNGYQTIRVRTWEISKLQAGLDLTGECTRAGSATVDWVVRAGYDIPVANLTKVLKGLGRIWACRGTVVASNQSFRSVKNVICAVTSTDAKTYKKATSSSNAFFIVLGVKLKRGGEALKVQVSS